MERKFEMFKGVIKDTVISVFIIAFILILIGVIYGDEDLNSDDSLSVFQDDNIVNDSLPMAPDARIEDLDFSSGRLGWTSGSASPYLLAPSFRYDGDNLVINTQNLGEYGWWCNDYANFSGSWLGVDSLFRAQFYVSTNQTNISRVPDIRFFMRNVSGQLNFAYGINSYNGAYSAPTDTPKMYEAFFVPHDGSLTPGMSFIYGLETANFNFYEPDAGEIYLSRVVLDRIDLSTLTFTNIRDFQLDTWRFVSFPDFSAPTPIKTHSQLGLKSPNNFDTYGLFRGEGDSVPFEADGNGDPYIYRASFYISTDVTNLTKVPLFRLSLQQISGREGAVLAIASISGSDSSPTPLGWGYDVFYKPPIEEVTTAPLGERVVIPTFELLNILNDDEPKGTIYLYGAKIDRISQSDLPVF